MPKHYRKSESVKKRIRTIAVSTLRNQMFRTNLKTTMKKYENAVANNDKANLASAYKAAVKKLDKAASRGIVHKNKAARKKSQFAKKFAAAK